MIKLKTKTPKRARCYCGGPQTCDLCRPRYKKVKKDKPTLRDILKALFK